MGVQINGDTGNVIATKGTFSGDVGIGGTLTYEDVTNIDAVGLITARSGIEIGARPGVGASISVDGNAIFSGITTVGGNIKVGSGITLSPDGDVFATGITTVGSKINVISSENTLGIFTSTDSGSNIDLFDSTAQSRIRTVSGRLHLYADFNNGVGSGNVADSSIRFFVDGNSEKARIASDGRVGIGTETANAKLHILHTESSDEPGILLEDGSVSSGAPYLEIIGKRSDGNIHQSFSGQVYLSRNRTAQKVSSGLKLGTILFGGNHTDGSKSNILYAASIAGVAGDDFDSASDMPTELAFYTGSVGRSPGANNVSSGNERLRITSDGKFGFGTDSPSTTIHILADGGSNIIEMQRTSSNTTGNVGAINFTASDGHSVASIGAYGGGDNESAYINFKTTEAASANSPFTSTTERMRISSDGTVNIPGGVDGNGLLHIGQNTSSYIRFQDLASTSDGIVIRKAVSSTYAALRLVNTNGHKGNLNVSNSGVALANASDYRLKENETTISDGITRVKQLIPRRFNFKTDSTTVDGFFAHEVSPIVPESVFGEKDATINEDGDGYQMLDQSKLIPVLTASIKELITKVETLEAEVAALKSN